MSFVQIAEFEWFARATKRVNLRQNVKKSSSKKPLGG